MIFSEESYKKFFGKSERTFYRAAGLRKQNIRSRKKLKTRRTCVLSVFLIAKKFRKPSFYKAAKCPANKARGGGRQEVRRLQALPLRVRSRSLKGFPFFCHLSSLKISEFFQKSFFIKIKNRPSTLPSTSGVGSFSAGFPISLFLCIFKAYLFSRCLLFSLKIRVFCVSACGIFLGIWSF